MNSPLRNLGCLTQLKTFLKSEASTIPHLDLSNLLNTKSIQACLSLFGFPLIAIKKSSMLTFFSQFLSKKDVNALVSSFVR